MRPRLSLALVASVLTLAACSDATAPSTLTPGSVARQGGTGGGGSTAISGIGFLPSTPPAPDVLVRESFGAGPDFMRPAGGKGDMRYSSAHVTLNSFWLEFPGSKSTQWISSEVGQTWKFCGTGVNPYELPSPLQPDPFDGCIASEWFDPPTTYPTALMPVTVALPDAGYELSMEGYPAPIPGAYVAIGFTSSGALYSNLTTSGSLWLKVTDPTRFGLPLHWELRTGSVASGQLIASGDGGYSGWNHMGLRYSPLAHTVTLSFADAVVGTFPVTIAPPKYLAFEGVGILDDLVLRQ